MTSRLEKRGFSCTTPDLPGHGGASAVPEGLDLQGAAALLAGPGGPLRHDGEGRDVVAGYSMGGRLALHLALYAPDLVGGLVLVSATGGIDDAAERAKRLHDDAVLADRIAGGGETGLGEFVDEWLSRPLFEGLTAAAAGREERLRNSSGGLAASLRALGTGSQEPLWSRLGELSMPVLVLAGERDEKFLALGRRLAAVIGTNAAFMSVPGAGHALCFERPGRFAEIVADFTDGTARQQGSGG